MSRAEGPWRGSGCGGTGPAVLAGSLCRVDFCLGESSLPPRAHILWAGKREGGGLGCELLMRAAPAALAAHLAPWSDPRVRSPWLLSRWSRPEAGARSVVMSQRGQHSPSHPFLRAHPGHSAANNNPISPGPPAPATHAHHSRVPFLPTDTHGAVRSRCSAP